ncbi:MAG: SsrA-binding protein [Kiritimatiellia bacterium]|jgi:SsrA-binding protein
MSKPDSRTRDLVVNRRARFNYEISTTYEAGIALQGSEVKSLRAGLGNLQEAYVQIKANGAWLMGCHISPYLQANRNNHDPVRPRQLLLHKHEIERLRRGINQKGMTIVPLRVYLKDRRIKIEIGLGKGKKLHDKRHSIKAREAKRDMDRRR